MSHLKSERVPPASENNLPIEIGHVLFVDIVGYSKRLISEQTELLKKLTEMVRRSEEIRAASGEGKLIQLATGDGMALVFRTGPAAPVQCALELAQADKEHPELAIRMGVHSGPINEITDLNDRANVTGAGINMAQRVMDCGDAGHILLSQRVADDLEQYPRWRPMLHDLGEVEVKHGARLRLVNLYNDEVGNAEFPEKLTKAQTAESRAGSERHGKSILVMVAIFLGAFLIPALVFLPAVLKSWRAKPASTATPLPAIAGISEKSIAVLPFENLSEEKKNAYFADGIQDEILTRLSKIADLKVISRTSTQRYKSKPESHSVIGKELGVANVLEGSVQKAGNRVRVNVQLIKAANDSHLWAETYDRELHDIFRVESEVAGAVADKLQATLTGREAQALTSKPTGNLDAYDAYLHGLEFDRRSESSLDLEKAALYLESAVKLDPNFALAWARLARVKANLYYQDFDITPATLGVARAAVQRAVDLAPELGETALAQGYFQFFCARNLDQARAFFEMARTRLPNDSDLLLALSLVVLHHGDGKEALALQRQAAQLDPRNPLLLFKNAQTLCALRRFPEARAVLDRALELSPDDSSLFALKASTYQAEGRLDEARPLVNQVELNRIFPLIRNLNYERRYADIIAALRPYLEKNLASDDLRVAALYGFLGRAEKETGDLAGATAHLSKGRDLALATIRETGGPQGRIHAVLALLYAGLGAREDAFREANRAIELEGDDAYLAPAAREVLARIEVEIGNPADALEMLPDLLEAEGFSWFSSTPLTPALLRLDPIWDPIRHDPRFQALAEEKQP